MTDIVERLRYLAGCEQWADDYNDGLLLAADEIERLRAESLAPIVRQQGCKILDLEDEVKRLRAALEEIAHPYTELGRMQGIAKRALANEQTARERNLCPKCNGVSNPFPDGSGYCELCKGTGLQR